MSKKVHTEDVKNNKIYMAKLNKRLDKMIARIRRLEKLDKLREESKPKGPVAKVKEFFKK